MPGGDGYELSRKVRAMDGASAISRNSSDSYSQRRGTTTRPSSEIPEVCGQTRGPGKSDFDRREYLSEAVVASRSEATET
jgi:hypothetical protein